MKNPCDICVVKACCTAICKEKYAYRDYIEFKVRHLWPHLYSINGNRRKHIPATIKKERDVYMKRMEKNCEDLNRIENYKAPIV